MKSMFGYISKPLYSIQHTMRLPVPFFRLDFSFFISIISVHQRDTFTFLAFRIWKLSHHSMLESGSLPHLIIIVNYSSILLRLMAVIRLAACVYPLLWGCNIVLVYKQRALFCWKMNGKKCNELFIKKQLNFFSTIWFDYYYYAFIQVSH